MILKRHLVCLSIANFLLPLAPVIVEDQPPPPPQGGARLDVRPFVNEVDADHDGCMSKTEWMAAGAPVSAYKVLVDAKGCVTRAKMLATAPPPGVDLNGDGKLTLREMKEFDAKMAPSRSKPLK
ncbi:hypothetical protein NHH88_22065 [Oxalobacteraceae bacterium OTU3CAMAD1]|nr:hypothetical protein NHH88_22065 [Oxalobacteraceae bacterium OTU3CAMAD1]